ncbi:hypothetical protein ABW21_db0206134 [Orbilia brochopaga]|nr:hypothetical protein ABW21_db0206134 [Drechslerella brochopaga]
MSAAHTLKLLNSIKTSTSSASHRHRRRSSSTAAAMFQSTNFFPHCQQQPQQIHPLYAAHPPRLVAGPSIPNPNLNDCMSSGLAQHGQQYQQFVPSFVTPATPASSDHQTSYHGTAPNVTSPLLHSPYSFHTPPISSIGGAGAAAAIESGRASTQQLQQLQQTPSNPHSHPHPQLQGAHKNQAPACISQFSAAAPSNFQFAFEAQPPTFDPTPAINSSSLINSANPAAQASASVYPHSRNHQLAFATQHQPQHQPIDLGFSFLPLNPEPTPACSPQPQHHHFKPSAQAALPTGCFFSLTPEDPHPPLGTQVQQISAVPQQTAQQSPSYFPIMPVNPVVQQVAPRAAFATGYMRPAYQRLTKHAVSAVDSRDSREFRWNRVLRYVHEISAPHGTKFPPSEAWIRQQRQRILSSPRDDGSDERHSLWDGGSLGTNGVDDFVWDDDLSNGKRFTIPPKSQQGDAPREEDNLVFSIEPSTSMKADYDLAFGYEVDDSNFHPPAKRTKRYEAGGATYDGIILYTVLHEESS